MSVPTPVSKIQRPNLKDQNFQTRHQNAQHAQTSNIQRPIDHRRPPRRDFRRSPLPLPPQSSNRRNRAPISNRDRSPKLPPRGQTHVHQMPRHLRGISQCNDRLVTPCGSEHLNLPDRVTVDNRPVASPQSLAYSNVQSAGKTFLLQRKPRPGSVSALGKDSEVS